jgi:hypothetical protein
MNEISRIKLSKTYGPHWMRVLGNRIKVSRKGWYQIVEALPTVEEFKAMLTAAFTFSVTSVIPDAIAELESLRDELQDWYDNLPEAFQSGDKGDQLQEAISSLDNVANELDVPEYLESVKVFVAPNDRTSRADRGGQAAYALRQAAERLEEQLEEKPVDDPTRYQGLVLNDDMKEEVRRLVENLTDIADEADGVEYPGMYS